MPLHDCTILIPTYRRPEQLRGLLDSILSYAEGMAVIIGDDDGSAAAVAAEYSQQIEITYLPPETNRGLAHNLGRLFAACPTPWLYLIHDDDFICERIGDIFQKYQDKADLIFTDHLVADDSGNVDAQLTEEYSRSYGRSQLSDGVLSSAALDLMLKQTISLDGFFLKREIALGCPFDHELGAVSDYFWLVEVSRTISSVAYDSTRTFVYRESDNGLTRNGYDHPRMLLGHQRLLSRLPDRVPFLQDKIQTSFPLAVNYHLSHQAYEEAKSLLQSADYQVSSINGHFWKTLQTLLVHSPLLCELVLGARSKLLGRSG